MELVWLMNLFDSANDYCLSKWGYLFPRVMIMDDDGVTKKSYQEQKEEEEEEENFLWPPNKKKYMF